MIYAIINCKGGDNISKFKDISGQKFGRLTALHRLHNTKGKTKWLCVCDCGNLKEIYLEYLTRGDTRSCGCLHDEGNHKTHGKRHTRIYKIWADMKKRCYNVNSKSYPNYGGRDIVVCSEWLNDFMAFYNWSVLHGYADNLTIDRINVNGNYEPNNCRWVTVKQQCRNKRNNRRYTINGVIHCLSEWCEILGLNFTTVYSRLYLQGKNIKEALELEGNCADNRY